MARPPLFTGDYHCRDRHGVVHAANARTWQEEFAPPVDETFCNEANYMDRTPDMVTCIPCLAELHRREQEEALWLKKMIGGHSTT